MDLSQLFELLPSTVGALCYTEPLLFHTVAFVAELVRYFTKVLFSTETLTIRYIVRYENFMPNVLTNDSA